MESLSFDRAADYYDRTRSLSDDAMRAVTVLLVAELGGRGPVLEIGVGTGRIALPLVGEKVPVTGIDLSHNMLEVLRARARAVPVAVADATRLPFTEGSFGAGLACHVLHLIPEWRLALEELARVVRPRGVVLIDLGGWGEGAWEEIQTRFVAEAGIDNPRRGATESAEVDAVMSSLGASVRVLPEVVDSRRLPYGELIDRIAQGLYSFTWSVDPDTRVRAATAVRGWAESELGPLDEPHEQRWTVRWRAYDLP